MLYLVYLQDGSSFAVMDHLPAFIFQCGYQRKILWQHHRVYVVFFDNPDTILMSAHDFQVIADHLFAEKVESCVDEGAVFWVQLVEEVVAIIEDIEHVACAGRAACRFQGRDLLDG